MKLYTIEVDGREKVAASMDGKVLTVLDQYASMNELIKAGELPVIPEDGEKIPAEEARILAPIPRPSQDVLCLGINYGEHAVEAAGFSEEAFGGERPYPIFFSKRVNYAPGPGMAIPSYKGLVDSLDYECEFGVILGKDAKNVPFERVSDYIFGYTIVNDISARNLQTRHKQWYFGKSLDGFCPMGPCIVTADEFVYPPRQRISCKINGELRQDSDTAHLLTGIGEIVAMLTQGMTLQAGTIIATGTPAGVGMGFDPPIFLKDGDVIECEIEGIGQLRNTVRDDV